MTSLFVLQTLCNTTHGAVSDASYFRTLEDALTWAKQIAPGARYTGKRGGYLRLPRGSAYLQMSICQVER